MLSNLVRCRQRPSYLFARMSVSPLHHILTESRRRLQEMTSFLRRRNKWSSRYGDGSRQESLGQPNESAKEEVVAYGFLVQCRISTRCPKSTSRRYNRSCRPSFQQPKNLLQPYFFNKTEMLYLILTFRTVEFPFDQKAFGLSVPQNSAGDFIDSKPPCIVVELPGKLSSDKVHEVQFPKRRSVQ